MVSYTLVVILAAYPLFQNGGVSTSVVVPGFTTEQACLNAAKKIKIPEPTSRVDQRFTAACVPNTI